MHRLLCLPALIALLAAPAAAVEPARLDYRAAPGCPDAPALRAAVADTLGHDPFDPAAARAIDVEVTAEHATVRLVDAAGRPSSARVVPSPAADCAELVQTAGFTAALLLDPFALPPTPVAEPPTKPPTPARAARRAPRTTRRPVVTRPDRTVAGTNDPIDDDGTPTDGIPTVGIPTDGTPTDGTPSDGTPSDGPPSDGIPTDGTPTDGIPADGIPTDGIPADEVVGPTADVAPPAPTRVAAEPAPTDGARPARLSLSAALGLDIALTPGVGVHLDGAARFALPIVDLALGARLGGALGDVDAGRVQSLTAAAHLAACHPLGPLDTCLGALAGYQQHRGSGFAVNATADGPLVTAFARVGWPLPAFGRTLTPHVELHAPLSRTTLTVDGRTGWQSSPLAAVIGLAVQ